MKRIISSLLVMVFVMSSVMTGCGSKEVDDSSAKADTQTEKAAATTEKSTDTSVDETKIELMHWWAYVTDDLIQQFEDEHPGVTVVNTYVAPDQYQNRLKLLSSTEELPDVFGVMGPDAQDFVDQELVEDLSYLLKEKAYDQDKSFGETIEPTLLTSAQATLRPEQIANGESYQLPFGAITVAVVYNKTIFDEVGIVPPTNWSELLDNSQKLKEAGYIPMSFTGKNWGDWWFRISMEQHLRGKATPEMFLDGSFKWTDQAAVDALNLVKGAWDQGVFDPGGYASGIEESQALFVQGRMAQFYVVPENFVTYLVENTPSDVEIGAYVLPAMVDGVVPKGLGGAPNTLNMSSSTKEQELAGELIKFLISETTFGKLADVAVVPSLTGYTPPEGDLIMKAFADAAAGGFITNPYQSNSEFNTWINKEGYPSFLLNNQSAEEFAEEIQGKYEEMVIKNQ